MFDPPEPPEPEWDEEPCPAQASNPRSPGRPYFRKAGTEDSHVVTPRLLLLTGPAAGDVAAVLRAATPAADPRQGASCDPWWDEVRDYEQAPRSISDQFCGTRTTTASGIQAAARRVSATDAAIRSLPGGEEWLVGLVLPAHHFCCFGGGQEYCAYRNAEPLAKHWRCEYCRRKGDLPARLAILAPEPPPLLVERVRAWGGDCWHLRSYDDGWCYITFEDGGSIRQMSWLEAVRAALGESVSTGAYVAYSKPKAMTEVTLLEQASYYRLLLAKEECSWGYAAKQLGVSKERLVEFMAELGLQPQLPTEINPHFPKEEDANE